MSEITSLLDEMKRMADLLATMPKAPRFIVGFPGAPTDSVWHHTERNVYLMRRSVWEALEATMPRADSPIANLLAAPVEDFDYTRPDHRDLLREVMPLLAKELDARPAFNWSDDDEPRPPSMGLTWAIRSR